MSDNVAAANGNSDGTENAYKHTALAFTPVDDIPQIREQLQATFDSGKSRSIQYRREQLLGLAHMMKDNSQQFVRALKHDLGRPALETFITEIDAIIEDCVTAYKKVKSWAKTEKAPFAMNFFLMNPQVRKEPKGVVLIIAPFNFPLLLLLGPFVGAIAAGNACVLKPSELVPATSTLIAELLPRYLDNEMYRVVNGAVPETTKVRDFFYLYATNSRSPCLFSCWTCLGLIYYTLAMAVWGELFLRPLQNI